MKGVFAVTLCFCLLLVYISLTQYEHSHIQAGFSENQRRQKDLLDTSEEEQVHGALKGIQVNTWSHRIHRVEHVIILL